MATISIEDLRNYANHTKQWGNCDKCNLPVPSHNNVAVFEFINSLGHWLNGFNLNRHIEPITNESGVVICEGSPSRWQDIAGVPDSRPEYQRQGDRPQEAMAIWTLMQTLKDLQLN